MRLIEWEVAEDGYEEQIIIPKARKKRVWNYAFLSFQGQELINNQFLASCGCTTDSGFAQTEAFADLRSRHAQISNRPVGRNTAGTYPIGDGIRGVAQFISLIRYVAHIH